MQVPDDIVMEMLTNMNLKEFIQFCSTNKKYSKMCMDEQYWKRLYFQFDIDLKSASLDARY
jgi:hypothetical protein